MNRVNCNRNNYVFNYQYHKVYLVNTVKLNELIVVVLVNDY